MRLFFDQLAVEAPLEEVTHALVAPVEVAGVFRVEPVHATGQGALRRLDDEMEMIGHQDPGQKQPVEPFDSLSEEGQIDDAVGVVTEDIPPLISARGDMPDSTLELQSQRSRHRNAKDPSVGS